MIITIDGPSGTGKSTVARLVAERLHFDYLDSGAIYRSLAWQILSQKLDPANLEGIELLCKSLNFHSQFSEGEWRYFLGEKEVTDFIRTPEVTELSSKIAVFPFVRNAIAALQREHAKRHHLVCEGRDTGTVIFPNAELKIFLTASAKVRAKRRFDELKRKFPDEAFDLNEIETSIINRDAADMNRSLAPLTKPKDATMIDTSAMSVSEVVQSIIQLVPNHVLDQK